MPNIRQKYLYTKKCSLYQPEWLTLEASLFNMNMNCIKNKNGSIRLPQLVLIMDLFGLHIQDSLQSRKYMLFIKILFSKI